MTYLETLFWCDVRLGKIAINPAANCPVGWPWSGYDGRPIPTAVVAAYAGVLREFHLMRIE